MFEASEGSRAVVRKYENTHDDGDGYLLLIHCAWLRNTE